MSSGAELMVVTDLDGCLLDEATYGFEPARPALALLGRRGVPLVLATSKTRGEIAPLWDELQPAAAIVENGGAVIMRKGPASSMVVLGEERAVLVHALQAIEGETGATIRSFSGMGRNEVAVLTGLDPADAGLALQREYDEPFLLEDEGRAAAVAAAAEARGLRVTRGGRFWHLTGATDKARALRTLIGFYAAEARRFTVVALGDSPNDVSLLRAADRPVVLPRPDGAVDPLVSAALPDAERAPHPGPAGWNAAVLAVLNGERLPAVAAHGA